MCFKDVNVPLMTRSLIEGRVTKEGVNKKERRQTIEQRKIKGIYLFAKYYEAGFKSVVETVNTK